MSDSGSPTPGDLDPPGVMTIQRKVDSEDDIPFATYRKGGLWLTLGLAPVIDDNVSRKRREKSLPAKFGA